MARWRCKLIEASILEIDEQRKAVHPEHPVRQIDDFHFHHLAAAPYHQNQNTPLDQLPCKK